jgi:hypothetical protein
MVEAGFFKLIAATAELTTRPLLRSSLTPATPPIVLYYWLVLLTIPNGHPFDLLVGTPDTVE